MIELKIRREIAQDSGTESRLDLCHGQSVVCATKCREPLGLRHVLVSDYRRHNDVCHMSHAADPSSPPAMSGPKLMLHEHVYLEQADFFKILRVEEISSEMRIDLI